MRGRLRPRHLRISEDCRRFQAHLSAVGEHVGVSVRIHRSGETLIILDQDGVETRVSTPYFAFQDIDLSHPRTRSMLLAAYLVILSRTSREWIESTMSDDYRATSSGRDAVAQVIMQVVDLLPSCEKYLSLSIRWGFSSPYSPARRSYALCLREIKKPDFDLEPATYAAVILYGTLSDSDLFPSVALELQSRFSAAELLERLDAAHRTLTDIKRFSELDLRQVVGRYDEAVRLLNEGRIMVSYALERIDFSAEVPCVRSPTEDDLDFLCPGITQGINVWVGPLSDDDSRVCLRVYYSISAFNSPLYNDANCRMTLKSSCFEVIGPLGPNALRAIAGRIITSHEVDLKNLVEVYLREVSKLRTSFATIEATSASSSR